MRIALCRKDFENRRLGENREEIISRQDIDYYCQECLIIDELDNSLIVKWNNVPEEAIPMLYDKLIDSSCVELLYGLLVFADQAQSTDQIKPDIVASNIPSGKHEAKYLFISNSRAL